MTIDQIWLQFTNDIQYVKWQEWISTLTQIASVWYARKNNILVYPTGIVGVILAAWVYFFISAPPLYADGVLNIYYFAMSVYGWYSWTQKSIKNDLLYQISWCNKAELLSGIIGFVIFWLIIFATLSFLTDSNTPLLDSLVSGTAVTAMWWMAKRKIENWFAWILSNMVAIPLNFYKGFMLFTLMYIIFLVMAFAGFTEWRRSALSTKPI